MRAVRHAACAIVAAIAFAGSATAAAPGASAPAPAPSCPPTATPLDGDSLAAIARTATDHGFLWRAVKDGRTSYLYGTIHAARPEWMFPGPQTRDALGASDTLALELDVLDPETQARLATAARARADEALPAELVQRLERRMAVDCIDPATLRAFAPELQVAMLQLAVARRAGFDAAYAVDVVLALVAKSLDKPVLALETPELQVAALRSPTRAAMLASIRGALDDLDAGRGDALLARMVRDWTAGDLADFEAYPSWCDCLRDGNDRATMRRLLDDRNPALAAAIDAAHAGGQRVFAAVGSLHMIGPGGLPALLARRGYRVERVPLTP